MIIFIQWSDKTSCKKEKKKKRKLIYLNKENTYMLNGTGVTIGRYGSFHLWMHVCGWQVKL